MNKTSCIECKNSSLQPYPTADWFEMVSVVFCTKMDNKRVGFDEPFDHPKIPKWCPRKKEEKK